MAQKKLQKDSNHNDLDSDRKALDEAFTHKTVLEKEIDELKSRYTKSGTGSLRTAVSTLEWRVQELDDSLKQWR
jgi:hypothetical protein